MVTDSDYALRRNPGTGKLWATMIPVNRPRHVSPPLWWELLKLAGISVLGFLILYGFFFVVFSL